MLIGYILPDSWLTKLGPPWTPTKIQESTGLLENTTDIFGDEFAYFEDFF